MGNKTKPVPALLDFVHTHTHAKLVRPFNHECGQPHKWQHTRLESQSDQPVYEPGRPQPTSQQTTKDRGKMVYSISQIHIIYTYIGHLCRSFALEADLFYSKVKFRHDPAMHTLQWTIGQGLRERVSEKESGGKAQYQKTLLILHCFNCVYRYLFRCRWRKKKQKKQKQPNISL